MHDKYVRRRRAVLAVLVAVSLILLTAYFGEAENSPLHAIQQGIVEVFTPIKAGASKVLSPVRDLSNFVSSTLHAKRENKELLSLNGQLERQTAQEGTALEDYDQLIRTLHMSNTLKLSQDGPEYASVIGYNPQVWYETIQIDKGAAAGIRDGDPVLSQGALVGDISDVGSNYAVVSGLSAPKFGVEARILSSPNENPVGTLLPAVGNPTTLQVNYLAYNANIQAGDQVVTAGLADKADPSPYPPGIPIGRIPGVSYDQLVNDGTVDVSPDVNLRDVSEVEVLTRVHS